MFNIVDDYSRVMVGQLVSVSISGRHVVRFLDELIEARGKPNSIVCDNGTETTSKAMLFWSRQTGLGFIPVGKPTQNTFVESFNGKFSEECLNRHWFRKIEEAWVKIDQWRHH